MNKRAILPFLALACLAGCASNVPIQLYTVQGPLAQRSPPPVYEGKASGFISGTLSVVLDDGEVCQGPWKLAHQMPVGTAPTASGAAKGAAPTGPDLSAAWDSVYGAGFYVAHVLGSSQFSRAVLTGNRGTVLNVELANDRNEPGNTKGVAQDNHGNVFKLVVRN